jgi:predicted GNAT family N-acyltransferase
MKARFTLQLMPWPEALPLARAVREKVFIEEQGVPRELEWDEWDERSDHVVAFDPDSNAIGTARLLPGGRVGRMAVLRPWRRKGVGAALLVALLVVAREKGLNEVALNAQTHAADFYRRFGFSPRGDEFMEAGIPHQEMRLMLSHSDGPEPRS